MYAIQLAITTTFIHKSQSHYFMLIKNIRLIKNMNYFMLIKNIACGCNLRCCIASDLFALQDFKTCIVISIDYSQSKLLYYDLCTIFNYVPSILPDNIHIRKFEMPWRSFSVDHSS